MPDATLAASYPAYGIAHVGRRAFHLENTENFDYVSNYVDDLESVIDLDVANIIVTLALAGEDIQFIRHGINPCTLTVFD